MGELMSNTTDEETAAAESAAAEAAEAERIAAEEAAASAAGGEKKSNEDGLGEAGQKALAAMKAERKAAKEEAAAAKAERDALQAKLDGRDAEYAAEQEKAAARAEALASANRRILSSEVKAAAKGVLADPADAYKFLDLDQFEVSEDGDVDESAIKAALDELVSKKPYLGVTQGDAKRFKGTGDGGPKGNAGKPQLTEADVKRMSREGKHAEIEQARLDGRLNTMLGIT